MTPDGSENTPFLSDDPLGPNDINVDQSEYTPHPFFHTRYLGLYLLLTFIFANGVSFLVQVAYVLARSTECKSTCSRAFISSLGHSSLMLALSLGGLWLGMLMCLQLAWRRWGTGSIRAAIGLRIQLSDIATGLAIGVGTWFAAALVMLVVIHGNSHLSQQSESASKSLLPGTGSAQAMLIPFLVVGAPIVEEIFFRGFLLSWLRTRLRAGAAIVVAGLCFGLAHSLVEPLGVPALAVVGMIFAAIYWQTGRLGPSIVAHGTFNAMTTILFLMKK